MPKDAISEAISLLGLTSVARTCGVTYQAVRKWERAGRLPRTEYTGETAYAQLIEVACRAKDPATDITRERLLGAAMDSAAVRTAAVANP